MVAKKNIAPPPERPVVAIFVLPWRAALAKFCFPTLNKSWQKKKKKGERPRLSLEPAHTTVLVKYYDQVAVSQVSPTARPQEKYLKTYMPPNTASNSPGRSCTGYILRICSGPLITCTATVCSERRKCAGCNIQWKGVFRVYQVYSTWVLNLVVWVILGYVPKYLKSI